MSVTMAPYSTGRNWFGAPSAEPAGSLLEYTVRSPGEDHTDVVWRENVPFKDTLQIVEIERGRSAARFVWEAADGRRFPMFMTDMLATARHGIGPTGLVSSEWVAVKKGQNYGIALASTIAITADGMRLQPREDPSQRYRIARMSHRGVVHIVHKPEWSSMDRGLCSRPLYNPFVVTQPDKWCVDCVKGFHYILDAQ